MLTDCKTQQTSTLLPNCMAVLMAARLTFSGRRLAAATQDITHFGHVAKPYVADHMICVTVMV